jgi:heme-degrading monooxygenase HmoA
MKIAVVYRPPALDLETYKASWALDIAAGNTEGLIFHAGIGEGDEFFTVSVWESRQAYEAFADGFRDTLGEPGFRAEKPTILPVHHTIDHGVPS